MTRLRSLLTRIRDTRSGATTDPLGLGEPAENMPADIPAEPLEPESPPVDPWLDAITPTVGEDTDPGGADLASPDPEPHHRAGAIVTAQTKYPGGRRCTVVGCGAPCVADVCVPCTAAGRIPAHVNVYVAPYCERILPDPPLHLLDGAGFVLEPLDLADGWFVAGPEDDAADFEEARDRLRGEIFGRIHPSIAPAEQAPTVAYLNRMLGVDGGDAA
jgi:hypothetical protein